MVGGRTEAEIYAGREDRLDLRDARAALAEAQQLGTVSWEDLKREVGL
jgi:hypothetical protein